MTWHINMYMYMYVYVCNTCMYRVHRHDCTDVTRCCRPQTLERRHDDIEEPQLITDPAQRHTHLQLLRMLR